MSDRQILAEHGTGLCVAALAAIGLPGPTALIPAAILAAWGFDRYKECSRRKQRYVISHVIRDLDRQNPDSRGVTAALQLLKENRDKIAVSAEVLADAEKRGNFPQTLYDIAFANTHAPPDDGVPEILRGVLTSAWQELRKEDDYHKVFVQESLTALEADLAGGFARIEAQLSKIENTTDQTLALVQMLVTKEAETARTLGIRETQLIALAQRIAKNVSDADMAYSEIQAAVEEAAALRVRGSQPSNLGDFVDAVMARVLKRSADGDLDGAEAEALAGLDDWRARQDEMAAQGLRIMELVIAQARQTRNVEQVVTTEIERVMLEHPDLAAQYDPLRERFVAYYTRGMDKGLALDLEVSIALMRCMAERFVADQDKKGACLTNLGTALCALGERESGTARLEEAVTVYHAALEERTRERVRFDWANTQNNLGNALWTLGARESGTARLEGAVSAYRAALEEWTGERVRLEWANTQNNLGNALWTLGARESGTARLEEAVSAYRAALDEWTREKVPLDWAGTLNNLGNALQTLGERESGTARLEEAVSAFRAALEERTRERVPLDWAGTQNNLGTALQTLGARESGTARLEEAVSALRAALGERTRERVPLDWANTQNNLGTALQTLGERESGTARLEEAVSAFRAALEERTRERVPLYWAGTHFILGYTESVLGERRGDAAQVQSGIARIEAALPVLDDGGHAVWAVNARSRLEQAREIAARLAACDN